MPIYGQFATMDCQLVWMELLHHEYADVSDIGQLDVVGFPHPPKPCTFSMDTKFMWKLGVPQFTLIDRPKRIKQNGDLTLIYILIWNCNTYCGHASLTIGLFLKLERSFLTHPFQHELMIKSDFCIIIRKKKKPF